MPKLPAMPHVNPPDAVKRLLPSGERLLYFGGLGTLAALGVLSWPVAGAIGGGVWIAGRANNPSQQRQSAASTRPDSKA